jgi:hypothetical protein
MVSLDLFQRGDVYLDYPFEGMKFRFEKSTGRVFGRFYGHAEVELPHSDKFFHEAISAGVVITPEEYLGDSPA